MFSKITRRVAVLAFSVLMITSTIAVMPSAVQAADTDNIPSSWAQASVEKAERLSLTTADLTNGYQAATTRAEFCRAAVNFLRKFGYEVDGVTPKLFEDTSDREIGIAAALKITSGTNTAGTQFTPDRKLTREEAATMLKNVLDVIVAEYADTGVSWTDGNDISDWAKTAADVVYNAKIMGGTSTTALVFSPKTPYSHEQSITTFVNLWNYAGQLPQPIINGVKLGVSASSVAGTLGVPFKSVSQSDAAKWCFYDKFSDLTIVCFENGIAKFVYSTGDLANPHARKYTDSNDNKKAYAVSVGRYSPVKDVELNELLIFEITNAFRSQHGLPAFTRNGKLDSSARKHSLDMLSRNFYDHVSPDGKEAVDRISAAGYNWISCGENIATGYDDGIDVTDGWINSPGHRVNILSTEYNEIGIGWSAGTYSTQDFAVSSPTNDNVTSAVAALTPLSVSGAATGYWDWYALKFDYDSSSKKLTAKNIAGQSKTFTDVCEYIGGVYAESGAGFLSLNSKGVLSFVDSRTFAAKVLSNGVAHIGYGYCGIRTVLTDDGKLYTPNLSPYALNPLWELNGLNDKSLTNLYWSYAFTSDGIYDLYHPEGEYKLLGKLDGTDNIKMGCNNRGYIITNGKSVYFLDDTGFFGKESAVLKKVGSLSDIKQIFADGSTGPTALIAVGNGDVYLFTPNEITKVDGLKDVLSYYGSFVLTADKKLWQLYNDAHLELVDTNVDALHYVDTICVYIKNNALYDAWTKNLVLSGLKDFFIGSPDTTCLGAFVNTVGGESYYLTLADINVARSIGLQKLELGSPISDFVQRAWNQELPDGECGRNYDVLKTADGKCYAVYIIIGNGSLKIEIRRIAADMS